MKRKNLHILSILEVLLVIVVTSLGSVAFASDSQSNCTGYKTYSQGAWGNSSSPQGTYLTNNFSTVFPNGITVGSSTNYLKFTTASAVINFLPAGGTPAKIGSVTLTNPTTSNAGSLAGQLLAVMISAEIDAKIPSYASASGKLYDLKIYKGKFLDYTVKELIIEANEFISGKTTSYTASDLTSTLQSIITSYHEGEMADGEDLTLVCPINYNESVVNNKCKNDTKGEISLSNVTGAFGSFTYLWSNGATTSTISNLSAGTYYVTVSGLVSPGKYITKKDTFTITEPTLLTAGSTLTTAVLCNGGDATITVSGNGGTPPYTGTGTFTVKAGTHEYTVTDANGCSTTTSITVTEPTLLTSASTATSILCNGGNSIITVTAEGGTAPYSGTGTYTVKAGTHEYTITDANGCSTTTSITVTEPTLLTSNSTLTTAILCNGGDAVITVSGDGGTAPYTGTGEYTVKAGTHEYTVTDANGCSATTSITVTEPTLLTASSTATAILCNGGDAVIIVSGDGGTAPYSGTGTYTVKAGTHEYTVTDANGCSTTTSITVTEPALLTASSIATAILCNGGDAVITVSGDGGTAPYSGTGTFTVKAGTHEYTVTDSNGCSTTTSITVTEPTLLTASSSLTTAILCNGGDAVITVSGDGGTAPYSGTGTYTVKAGTHEYTVTDSNGCSTTTSITVTEPTVLSVGSSATEILCNGGNSTITIIADGGTAPYTGTGDFTVKAGTYEYTVTDANGCSVSTSITVTEPTALALNGTTTKDASCNGGLASGTATVSVSGGKTPYTYTWTNASSTTSVATGIAYNVTPSVLVTDANGCTSTFTFNAITCDLNNACEALKTFTQGGWGSTPNGNNPGTYLNNNFAAAFPNGLKIGYENRKAVFTSALAIRNFLPSGGSSSTLPKGTLTNPTKTNLKNTLAGQLVAAMLNVGFDTYSPSFAAPATKLADMYCNFSPFKGVTVSKLLSEANKVIGGEESKYSLSQLNDALTKLNENYDNGTKNNGYFVCQPVTSSTCHGSKSSSVVEDTFNVYPNPATDNFTVNFSSTENTSGSFRIFNLSGQLIYENTIEVIEGVNTLKVNLNDLNLASNMLLVNISFSNNNFKKMIVIK